MEVWRFLKEGGWITGQKWWKMKVEKWVRFNIGKIVEDFLVLENGRILGAYKLKRF